MNVSLIPTVASIATHFTNVPIGVVQLNAEFQLVTNLDSLGVCILQASGQGLGHVQNPRALVSLSGLIDDFDIVLV